MSKRIDKKANRRATDMFRRYLRSGLPFDQFLIKDGKIKKQR